MQIISVTLDNIKSYRRAVIHLTPGTTAIRGHNGAGKSTLVEAIGYALFDFLPYSPAARFIREGEKMGKVVVSFVSALDERLYEVERRCVTSGAAAWFVVDPELRQKVVEGKDDTLAFLRLHLGMQTTLPLPDLFDNAIAVQQGTFTADFLGTGAARKKKFDALLQVEDYRRAAEELRDTVSHLKDALAAHDRAIEGLIARTADIEAWRMGRATLFAERMALTDAMAQLITDHAALTEELAQAQRRRAALAELTLARDRAQATWQVAEIARAGAEAEATRAAEAHARCAATEAAYLRHQATQSDLARAQEDARILGELGIALAGAEHAVRASADALTRAHNDVEAAQAAAAEVVALTPLAARQDDLDRQMHAARGAATEAQRLRAEAQRLAQERATTERELADLDRDLAHLATLKPLAEQLSAHTAHLSALTARAATGAERQKRRAEVTRQLARHDAALARVAEEVRAAEALWRAAQEAAAACADLPARESALTALTERMARLHAEITQTETSLHAAENGHCPFLKEPCQNLAKRNIRGLDVYFGDQLARLASELLPLEGRHADLTRVVGDLRAQEAHAARLADYDARLAQARALHGEHQTERERLLAEQSALAAKERDAATLAQELAAATRAVEESTRADRACARLATLGAQRTAAAQRLADHAARQAALEGDLATAQALAATLPALTATLAELGDPRARLAVCAAESAKLPAQERALAEATARHATALHDLAAAQERLRPYEGVTERIAALRATLAATKDAHDDYLRHEEEARQMPARQAHLATTTLAATEAQTQHAAAEAALAAAAADLDPAAVERLTEQLHAIDTDLTARREHSRYMEQQIATLDRQIAEAEVWLRDLHAAQVGRGETEATLSLLHYCRDTIKEAGPFVMRALLREISATANRIFGEIMGDRSAMLTWQEDYDIVVRTGAYERHFAQLSGGEQMSAALAVRLALLRTLTRATIAFFDEPTQNMDDERRANLAAQIRRVTGFDQLLVISHDDTFEEGLDAVIRVHKEGGESVVESDPAATLPTPIIPFPTTLTA